MLPFGYQQPGSISKRCSWVSFAEIVAENNIAQIQTFEYELETQQRLALSKIAGRRLLLLNQWLGLKTVLLAIDGKEKQPWHRMLYAFVFLSHIRTKEILNTVDVIVVPAFGKNLCFLILLIFIEWNTDANHCFRMPFFIDV